MPGAHIRAGIEKVVFGWPISFFPRIMIEAQFHAAWRGILKQAFEGGLTKCVNGRELHSANAVFAIYAISKIS